jgi:hypothetical protein
MNAGRLRTLLAVALVLLAVVDFTRRVHVPRDVQARDASSFVPADVAPPVTAATVSKDLATWLPGLTPVAEGAGTAAATDWALTLLGVFSERGAPFAVIRATPAAGGAARVQRIAEGDEVYGFKVAQIEPQRVQLEGAGGAQELQIFKPAQTTVKGSGAPPAAGSAAGPSTVAPLDRGTAAAATGRASGPPQPRTPAAATGPKQVQATELQPGQAFELPASMRGLKVVDAPVPPPKSDAGGKSPQPQPAPPPQKP